jgi:hypothetical protein
LINAHVALRDGLVTDEIERTIEEVEGSIKRAEPRVEMIFLEAARKEHTLNRKPIAEHIG